MNGNAAGRKGDYFWKLLTVDNANGAVWTGLTITATPPTGGTQTNQAGGQVLPPHTEGYVHDADGNLTQDGLWNYTWDAENRLVAMQAKDWGNANVRLSLAFGYDWMGRRIRKTVKNGGVVTEERRYVYDGWNLVAELDKDLNLVRSYVWGKDLSGSLQGAGGVGGLLAMNTYTANTVSATHYAGYDGNGNVMVLVNAANGVWSGQYEYGPFGEVLRVSGAAARENPFRFSTKYEDTESGLLYYGYRYYNPSTGRWLSRDPIGEKGGRNLAGYNANNAVGKVDFLGLSAEEAIVVTLPATVEITDEENVDRKEYAEPEIENTVNAYREKKRWLVVKVENIKDANKKLLNANCKCIKELNITGHGNEGFQNVVSVNDLNRKTPGYGRLWAQDNGNGGYKVTGLEMFDGMTAGGKFCKKCKIILRGCKTAVGAKGRALLKAIAKKTGCKAAGYDTETSASSSKMDGGLPGNGFIVSGPNVEEDP